VGHVAAIGATIALVCISLLLVLRKAIGSPPDALRKWADRESLTLIEARRRAFFRGPFIWRPSFLQRVYRISAKCEDGRTLHGYAGVGGFFTVGDKVSVEWDREYYDFPCPCCGYLVFDQLPGSSDVCPICFWEDDVEQLAFPDLKNRSNIPSLREAQQNFTRIGAVETRFRECVCQPAEAYIRDVDWRPFDPSVDPHLSWSKQEDHERWKQVTDTSEVCLYYWRPDYWLHD
jgi:hypothetical protein